MTNKQTGGPAFPAPAGVSHITEQGMTLRDYFAAKAMQAHVTAQWQYFYVSTDNEKRTNPFEIFDPQNLTDLAYDMADEMLKARDGTT